MSDLLTSHQKTAFLVLAGLLRDRGPLGRDELRVLVAAQGTQLGRDYVRFRELGLVEEIETRPGFLRRLFGARSKTLVTLTESGRALAAPSAGQGGETVEPQAVEAPADGAPHDEDQQKTPPEAEPVADEPQASEEAGTHPTAAENVPDAVADIDPPKQASDAPLRLMNRAPKRFALSDYTDVLGGVAQDIPVTTKDDERLEGLAELLGLLGLEITFAGEFLASKRWSEGHLDADIALEIAVVAVAHAARLHHVGTAQLLADEMLAQIDTIIAALGKMVPEGQLTEEQLDESAQAMKLFVLGGDEAISGIDALLSDPLRGMAPPATFPDDVWRAADVEDETT